MEKSLLVRIFVPTLDADKRDGGGRVGAVGTGYPVAQDVILTARHVLEPDDRDDRYPIAVCWHDFPDPGPAAGWYELTKPDDIIWIGQGELDAALLRCPRPPGASRYRGLVAEEAPRQGARWNSAGFPRAAKRGDVREHASFAGRMHSMTSKRTYFETDVDVSPSEEEDWKGASGMPIFAENTVKILGVAKEVPRKFKSERLHATAACKLLKDDGFRKAIGYADQLDRRGNFERKLRTILKKSDRAIEAIRESTDLLRDADLDPADKATVAARCLLDRSLEDVIVGLSDANDAIVDELRYQDSSDLMAAAEILAEALQLAVPYLFDSGVARGLRAHMLDPQAAILEVPCALSTVAEVVMAAVEDRETRFLPPERDGQYPDGTRLLPHPPESGIGSSQQDSEAIHQALIGKFRPGEWGTLRHTVDDYFFKAFVHARGGPDRTRQERIKMTSIEIENVSRRHRYYMVYYLPKDEARRRELEDTIRQLKNDYPAIVFLALTDDFEVEQIERRTYGRLPQLLRRKRN